MSNTTTTTMFGMIALFAVGMIFSPLSASATVPYPNYDGNFLELKKAIVDIQSDPEGDVIKNIVFKTRGEIPQDGSAGNFGYGVVTLVDGTLNVIATTSHGDLGIVDSELQQSPDDPVFHNHYVVLGTNEQYCGTNEQGDPNLAIADLSFTSPGEIIVKDNKAILKDLPQSAEGQLDPDLTTTLVSQIDEITPGADIQLVASFLLEPVFNQQDELLAVCVTDVLPIEPQDERTVIFGEKDFHPDKKPSYGQPYGHEYTQEMPYNTEYGYGERYHSSYN